MVCGSEGMTSTIHHKSHKPMSTTFTTDFTDHELQLNELAAISGGKGKKGKKDKKDKGKGKEAKKPFGKWIEKTFGDGDGRHEVDDYADEAIAIITVLIG